MKTYHPRQFWRGKWGLTVGLSLLFLAGLPAQGGTIGTASYNVRIWQTDDGLPQNSVHAIAQTPEGYLWIGTEEGLVRFDGVRFTSPFEKAAPELKHASIAALCAGRDGSLWVAALGYGLARLKGGVCTRLSETDGLLSNQIKCLLEAKDGSLWIGSDGGLMRLKEGKLSSFTEKNGLAANGVRGLCEDRQGNLRIATLRGLSSLNKEGTISTYNFDIGTIANALKFVCTDRNGKLWTGSNEALYSLDGDKQATYRESDGLPDRIVVTAYEDRSGQLWVGTYRGLGRMIEGKFLPKPGNAPVFGDWIYSIFEDREGNLWVGSQDGLYRLNPARFTTYTTQQGLSYNNAMSVFEDRAGTVWIGTWGGGLDQIKDGEIVAFGSTGGTTRETVLGLHEARDGSVWVGRDHSGGLSRFKGGPRNLFPRTPGLIDAALRVVHQDRRGWLWVGTSRGLNILRGGKFYTFTTAAGLAGNTVLAICESADGSCWIGTDTGLSHWQEDKFTNYTTSAGLSANYVNGLYEDREKRLWIGTRGGGLDLYQNGKFTAYTTKEGLFSDEVYEVVEDDFGYFWMSCRKGIFRVSKKDLDDLDHGRIKTLSCTAFGITDGLLSVQCNGVAKPAGWKGKDGRLWFPTIRGVVAVDSRIKANERPPPVLIEGVIADKNPIEDGRWKIGDEGGKAEAKELRVPAGHGELEVVYTALSFQAPEKNRFKYMLENYDSGWVDAGSQRTARYNNLPPGRYRFRVTACNNDGVWNEAGATLGLVFRPHYWQTWWFRPAIAAAIGLLLAMFYRTRVARLRALESLRIQIAANLHDDVGSRLTKVAMVTEQVEREIPATDRSKPLIQNISRTTREVIQAMDEIVWTINPKNDTLDNLANYIFQYAQEYFQNTGVRCRLDVPPRLPDQQISTEERHNLFMAVKEALNNVLKHAGATEVRLTLAVTGSRLTVLIADNGRGFIPDPPHPTGNGLQNMKTRLESIGGRLVLETKPGEGTRIRMEANGK